MDLKALIEQTRRESYTADYQDKVSDAEVMGLIISRHFEWDGIRIMETFVSALEDANFHTESAIVADMLTKEKAL